MFRLIKNPPAEYNKKRLKLCFLRPDPSDLALWQGGVRRQSHNIITAVQCLREQRAERSREKNDFLFDGTINASARNSHQGVVNWNVRVKLENGIVDFGRKPPLPQRHGQL